MDSTRRRLVISLSAETFARLQARAQREDRPVKAQAARILRDALSDERVTPDTERAVPA